jgi:hypothetical protein
VLREADRQVLRGKQGFSRHVNRFLRCHQYIVVAFCDDKCWVSANFGTIRIAEDFVALAQARASCREAEPAAMMRLTCLRCQECLGQKGAVWKEVAKRREGDEAGPNRLFRSLRTCFRRPAAPTILVRSYS